MLRLLIIDDEEIIRDALSKIVRWEDIGYKLIGVCQNGMEAYDIICDEYPDVVITDLKMPVMDGIELIQRAIGLDKNISFIILSGYGEFEYAKKAMKYGVRHYLLKPTDKQQVIDALLDLKALQHQKQSQQLDVESELLQGMKFTVEKCFLFEALNSHAQLSSTIAKYRNLLTFPKGPSHMCICSFLEEQNYAAFAEQIHHYCRQQEITILFPVIYLRNVVVFIVGANSLSSQPALLAYIKSMEFKSQRVSLDATLHMFHQYTELMSTLIEKIQRFNRILLFHPKEGIHEVMNNGISSWKLETLCQDLKECNSGEEANRMIREAFLLAQDKNHGISFGIGLSLRLRPDKHNDDILSKYILDLNKCDDLQEVLSHTQKHISFLLFHSGKADSSTKEAIMLLRHYVEGHLDASHLSLKWLAENYLYMSVGYLSKQFLKEMGIRFSDYLNQQRMEKALSLLRDYPDASIKDIAAMVGYGNNPRYFGQVFKRYTGYTPSDYMEEKLFNPHHHHGHNQSFGL